MISYLILHYNRPFLLDLHISLIRKYAPPGTKIIVADDGSYAKIADKISDMGVDFLFHQSKNKNTWKDGTCSNTLKEAILRYCNEEYFVYAEDDFIFSPNPIVDCSVGEEDISPSIKYADCTYNIFEESISLLKDRPDLKNIQLARDSDRVPHSGGFKSKNSSWLYVDHKVKKESYYCNWPSMTSTETMREMASKFKDGQPIWQLEQQVSRSFDKKFGGDNWAVMLENKHYVHVGHPFSKRLKSFYGVEKREKHIQKLVSIAMPNKKVSGHIEKFNEYLIDRWIDGSLRIDIDDVFNHDLNYAFVKAFKRLDK